MTYSKILENKLIVIFVIPLFLGCITVFGFQPFNFTIINFFCLSSLFLIIAFVNKKLKSRYRKKTYLIYFFFIGYFFGIGFFLTGTFWISNSLKFDENLSFLIPFSIIGIPIFLGIFSGLTCLVIGSYIKNNFQSLILFSTSLAINDYLRSIVLTGFPWNLWAYSWSWSNESLQSLKIFGLHGFNLLTLIFFCLPALFFNKDFKKKLQLAFVLVILIFSFFIYGSFKINSNKNLLNNDLKSINIKVISPGFDLNYDFSDENLENLTSNLIKYSNPEKNKNTIFIWPEGVFAGFYFSEILKIKEKIYKNFSKKHLIILGINTRDEALKKTYNSLLVLNNNLEVIYKYNKKKLVPFGEYIPFKKLLNSVGLKKLTYGYDTFSKGEKMKNFFLGDLSLLPLICYEIIFPELVQKSDLSTNLIVNISEDAWFGSSIGPAQHFAKAKFRAIENNNYLVRSANKGYSAIISNTGEVLKSLKPSEIGSIEIQIPLEQRGQRNKNDLIFLLLLITNISIFLILQKK